MYLRNKNTITNAVAVSVIAAVVFLSYFNVLAAGFITDDFGLVVNNPNIKSWSHLAHIFSSGYWDAAGCARGLYRPLTIFSFLLEYTFFGLDPRAFHLNNILLHLAASVLCFFLLKELFKDATAPLAAVILFTAHPVHSEAVAWISGRAELLSAVLSLASILIFIKKEKDGLFPLASVLVFFLALMSKESAVIVPLALIIYCFFFQKRQCPLPVAAIKTTAPYIIVLLFFLVIKFIILGTLGPQGWDQAFWGISPWKRFLTMNIALFEYLRLGFMPFDLRADYFFPAPESVFNLKTIAIWAALIGLAVITAVSGKFSQRAKPYLFGTLWFLAALVPVSNIIPAGIIMSERAMYMPSLGVCLVIGFAATEAASLLNTKKVNWRLSLFFLVMPVLLLFVVITNLRNGVWKDQDVFIKKYVFMLKKNIQEHPEYSALYKQEARMMSRYCGGGPETEMAVRRAIIRSGPDFELHAMLAGLYSQKGMYEESLQEIREAIRLYPQSYYIEYEATLLFRLGRTPEALDAIETALKQNPDEPLFHIDRGEMLLQLGNKPDATKEFKKALELDPENKDAARLLGSIY